MLGQALLDAIYPVGRIITTESATDNPNTLYNGTGCTSTWIQYGTGKVLVGIDTSQTEFKTIGQTGGEKIHTLSINEMPVHSHTFLRQRLLFDEPVSPNWSSIIGSTNSATVDGMKTEPSTYNSGAGWPHNNLQPYVVVYRWKRTA